MADQTNSKVPKIRFKGFEVEWKQVSLGEVLTERNVLQKITEDAPILAFAAGQGVIPRSERKSNNRDHLTLDQANKFYKLTEYDDLVYNPSNLKYGAIDRNKHGRGVISPIYVTFTTKEIPCFIEVTDQYYLRVLHVRHCLIHSDARRGIFASTKPLAGHEMRFRYMVASPAGTMLDTPVEDVQSREVIKLACTLATTHVVRFVETIEKLPPQPRPQHRK